ncbi:MULTISPECIES: DapH/DapD/GlmU-related protein [Pseudonocardia]|uniref:Maltose O-acetyltransferase n=2 Tax=Pseudonocardia TaxID=1847 RepID=A0ABQ0S6R0_9PSEU|nr:MULTISPECIES: DapH/DapD/GlmU-related protein [Pseudonocardia]OSY38072.1 putative acetyltransferase [Pseudonocardia autotrophica]BBF99482.1 hypothetical protein Pdca_06920 [Pseudonocardia autotrophica]GEC28483.1 hypothetical protein PSA01_55120 [Pseudonocardia saturnea]
MGEHKDRMLRNEWYLDEPDLVEDHDRRRAGWERPAPIAIGADAWLGAGVIICPGVTIGPDSVVGAGSVVTRDVGERVLVAGNPARTVRRI